MTRRRERWVTVLTGAMTLGALSFLIGCPPPTARLAAVGYQEVGIIQMDSRFVPSEVVLVKGRPARLHVTNVVEKTADFVIRSLDIRSELRLGQLTQITVSAEQVDGLDGKTFDCPQTGHRGAFRVVEGTEPLQRTASAGAVEQAVVMTDDLAAPRIIFVKKGTPLKLFVTKTQGEEDSDTILIEAWGIRKDIQFGQVTQIDYTPTKAGKVTYLGIVTPSSRGTIEVLD